MITRSTQRFTIAIAVLTLNALLMVALVYMSLMGKEVTGENILYMVVGGAMAWGAMPLQFYFGTSESSVHKTEIMERQHEVATGKQDDPVHVEPQEPQS